MSWEHGKKFVGCKPDENTRWTFTGWIAGVDYPKLIANEAAKVEKEHWEAKLAKKAKKAKKAEQALAARVKTPAPIVHSAHEQPGPTPTTIPQPGPPAPASPTGANVATFVSVSTVVDAGIANSNTDPQQYPVPYPVPFPVPIFAPPPPGPPADSFPPPQQQTTSVKPEPVGVTRTRVVYREVRREGEGHLPSRATYLAAHHCSECGRLRSKEYHRQHPLTPGTVASSGPCRRCRHRDSHRFEEIDEKVQGSRRHEHRSSGQHRVYTETTIRQERSISPAPRRESSPRGRRYSRPERCEEGEVRYRHVSVRRSSEEQPRNVSRREETRHVERREQSRECRRTSEAHRRDVSREERRPAERRKQSREYRREKIVRVSPPSEESTEEEPIGGSELIVRRRGEVFREVSPKDQEVSSYHYTRTRKVYRDSLVLPDCFQGTSECEPPQLIDRMANALFEGSSATRASQRHWSRIIGLPPQSIRD